MATGSPTALSRLSDAYRRPWEVADAWRDAGGLVVGVLGHDLPREIVAAGGALPIRLSPLRLARDGRSYAGVVPDGLVAQMAPGPVRVLGALLAGRLDWIDALAIGRDTEANTSLFTILRELVLSGEVTELPPFAICDLLVTRTRPSAVYNRRRFRTFAATVAAWTGSPIGAAQLADAVAQQATVARQLAALATRRRAPEPALSGSEALIAAGAAQVLPAPRAAEWLSEVTPAARIEASPRLYLTGSGIDDPSIYAAIEEAGAMIVGEDHEWGDDGGHVPAPTADPIDGIVDRYQLGPRGAARSGLLERVGVTVAGVRACRAEAVLQVVHRDDETPPWELPRLREALGALPVATVTVEYGEPDPDALAHVVQGLIGEAVR